MHTKIKTRQEEFWDKTPKIDQGMELYVFTGLNGFFSALSECWIVIILIQKLLYFFDQNSVFWEAIEVFHRLCVVASVLLRYLSIEANSC